MATEEFIVRHTSSKTVYFRFYDPLADELFDYGQGSTWQASPTDTKLSATEKTAMGDADESLYVASQNLLSLYNSATPKNFIVQAMDDLATDEIIQEAEFFLADGEVVSDMRGDHLNDINTILAGVRGKNTLVGDDLSYYDTDSTTVLFTHTLGSTGRTVV